MADVIPVLISGGRGTRLWPLSRSDAPKQLQSVVTDRTLIQDTALRIVSLDAVSAPIVVCNVDHLAEIRRQLADVGVPPALVLAEPAGRHTAAAVTAAVLVAPAESIVAVLPADAAIADGAAFREAFGMAVAAAAAGSIAIFGVVPDRPETGYGWIEAPGEDGARPVRRFVEKPDESNARAMLDGNHFWNSGMFVMRADVALGELRRYEPGIVDTVVGSLRDRHEGVIELGPEFLATRAVAFDIAVMERTDRAVMVPLDAGWDDVGSWRSLWARATRDEEENATVGDVVVHDSRRSYVRAGDRTVVVSGVEDLVVVDTGDVVLVTSMERAQDLRDLVARLDDERPDLT